jgi:hypothetical protein
VSLIVVSAGPCACKVVANVNAISNAGSIEITAFAAIRKRWWFTVWWFTANDLGISCSLLVSARDPNSGQ